MSGCGPKHPSRNSRLLNHCCHFRNYRSRAIVNPREIVQLAAFERAAAAFAIGFEERSIGWVGKQWHVPEDVVKDVRLFEIVELVFGPDEGAGWEAAAREMLEEGIVWHQPGRRASP